MLRKEAFVPGLKQGELLRDRVNMLRLIRGQQQVKIEDGRFNCAIITSLPAKYHGMVDSPAVSIGRAYQEASREG